MASLILHPTDAAWSPHLINDLYSLLQTIGLAGGVLPEGFAPGFLIGDSFLSLVTFMGCAPAINLEPDGNQPEKEFCSIRIRMKKESPQFLIAPHYPPPRCPHCRSVVEIDGESLIAEMLTVCNRCDTKTPVHALNWRKAAGYARCFVEITGVYPQEALPTETLMNALQGFSGCEWRYFYS